MQPGVLQRQSTGQAPRRAATEAWTLPQGGVLRAASAVVGGLLLSQGIRRRSLGGAVLALAGEELLRQGLTGKSLISQAMERGLPSAGPVAKAPAEVVSAITINKDAATLFEQWRKPGTLRQIMGHAVDVTETDATHAHWVLTGPMNRRLEWDTEVVDERPGELLRLRSRSGAVPGELEVRFRPAPAQRGTEVCMRLRLEVPAALMQGATKVMDVLPGAGALPGAVAGKALHRFKSLIETGEIPTIRPQPACRGTGRDE